MGSIFRAFTQQDLHLSNFRRDVQRKDWQKYIQLPGFWFEKDTGLLQWNQHPVGTRFRLLKSPARTLVPHDSQFVEATRVSSVQLLWIQNGYMIVCFDLSDQCKKHCRKVVSWYNWNTENCNRLQRAVGGADNIVLYGTVPKSTYIRSQRNTQMVLNIAKHVCISLMLRVIIIQTLSSGWSLLSVLIFISYIWNGAWCSPHPISPLLLLNTPYTMIVSGQTGIWQNSICR